jgi:hypothetical protein
LQFANAALKGSGTLVVLAIYCKYIYVRYGDMTTQCRFKMHIQRRTKDLFTNEQLSRLSRIFSKISKLKNEKEFFKFARRRIEQLSRLSRISSVISKLKNEKKIFLIYTKEDQAIFEMGAVQPFLPWVV